MRRGIRSRGLRTLLVFLAVLVALPLPSSGVGAQEAALIGAGPFAVISEIAAEVAAATAQDDPDCGLTTNQLIALSLAPTYAENTGGTITVAPSPMTLGRFDVDPSLSPPADVGPSGAFWHTSIGLWQLDSGGLGSSTIARERIAVTPAARVAITSIANGWCFGGFQSVFIPWVACRAEACDLIYNGIYHAPSDSLRVVTDQSLVAPDGGLDLRTCLLSIGVQVECGYVDPQAAEGHRAFLADGFGPAPVSAPFYSFRVGGDEVRLWLADDDPTATEDVWAVRSEFSSAHSSLLWSTSYLDADFCDLDTRRGDCPPPCFGAAPTIWDTRPEGAIVFGTDGDDVVLTGAGNDQIATGPGNDRVCAGAGDDVISTGDGDDLIDGFEGNDAIWGQNGNDQLSGKFGDDKLRGGDGDDLLEGGPGVDDLNGGRGDDEVQGGDGADAAVRGGTGDDRVFGGPGDDGLVNGNGGEDFVYGGNGADFVIGGPRPDEVYGEAGDDTVRGLGGADLLFGGDGNDSLFGGRQPDTLDGGGGIDTCNGGTETDTALASCESVSNLP